MRTEGGLATASARIFDHPARNRSGRQLCAVMIVALVVAGIGLAAMESLGKWDIASRTACSACGPFVGLVSKADQCHANDGRGG